MKKLVYVYLVRYAEEQQDLALLSISTFQRGLKVRGLRGVWASLELGEVGPGRSHEYCVGSGDLSYLQKLGRSGSEESEGSP